MLRRILLVGLMVVVATAGAMSQGRQPSVTVTQRCKLRVWVVSDKDQRGIPNLTVQLMDAEGVPSDMGTKQTDDAGKADFNTSTGGHRVRIYGPGILEYSGDFGIATIETTHIERIEVRVKEAEKTESAAGKSTVPAARLRVPGKAQKEYEKGTASLQEGQYAAAKQRFESAIALYPEYDLAYNSLGIAEMDMQNADAARMAFGKAVALNPDFAAAQRNLGRLLLAGSKFQEAAEALEHSLETEPGDVWALDKAAYAELRAQKFALAVAHARQVHQLPHESYAESHYIAGLALEALGQQKEALSEYQLYLQEEPRGANAALARTASQRLTSILR